MIPSQDIDEYKQELISSAYRRRFIGFIASLVVTAIGIGAYLLFIR